MKEEKREREEGKSNVYTMLTTTHTFWSDEVWCGGVAYGPTGPDEIATK